MDNRLYIVEYKAFQPIHETNIIGSDPITKKDDKTGIIVTMIKRIRSDNTIVLSVIVENPNSIENTITGNLEIPFPSENNVRSQIVKINNVIDLVLIVRSITEETNVTTSSNSTNINSTNNRQQNSSEDFITVSRKTFADRVKTDSSAITKPQSKLLSSPKLLLTKNYSQLNTYKDLNYPSAVSATVNSKLNSQLKKIIDEYRESINEDRCFRYNEKSNCLIVASHKNVDTVEICKQCKNKLALGAKELSVSEYKCTTCSEIVFINDNGVPNFTQCNSCLSKDRKSNIEKR